MAKRQTSAASGKRVPSKGMDARQRKSRQALRAALLTLIERKPLDQISIRDITAEAGIGYATFFRHFPSRDALLDDIVSAEIDGLVEQSLQMLFAADTRASCATMCSYVMERRALWKALLVGGAGPLMRDAYIRAATQVAMERWPVATKPWLPTELGIIHSSSSLVLALTWWLSQPELLPVEQMAEIMDRLIIQPILKDDTVGTVSEGGPAVTCA